MEAADSSGMLDLTTRLHVTSQKAVVLDVQLLYLSEVKWFTEGQKQIENKHKNYWSGEEIKQS